MSYRSYQDKDKLDLTMVEWDRVLPCYIDEQYLGPRWGECPLRDCGGTDTFKVYGDGPKRKGKWRCCKCNDSGDYLSLIHKITGKSYRELFAEIESKNYNGGAPIKPVSNTVRAKPKRREKSPEEKRRELQEAWDGAGPVTEVSAVWKYLSGRIPGLKLEWIGPDVRFHPGMIYYDHNGKSLGKWPVFLQRLRSSKKEPRTLQRCYLTPDGEKVPFKNAKGEPAAKKQMSSPSGPAGGTIHLNTTRSRKLFLTEGSETGYAVVAKYENRYEVRALLDAGNLARLDLDWDAYDEIVIVADRDKVNKKTGYRPGEHFAEEAAAKAREHGKRVRIPRPVEEGVDFCDIWARQYARMQARVAARAAREAERAEARVARLQKLAA
ncbi:DUF7146 domain-containing protein [Paraburkholderia youngii]|uniref:DUF7146 domain-containing protein n=1 Tax=Paraburkholderia youngii TaxID=2782701 RepID=UPI003D1DE606